VFLSLVLVLLFSFILTTLEAARIRGATAYVSMVTNLAGESVLASYYYPLFQNYRLFGVNAGGVSGVFSEEALTEEAEKSIRCSLEESKTGLLQFQNTEAALQEYETLLCRDEQEFLSQIKQQVLLDSLSLTLSELFSAEQFTEAGVVGEIYQEQEAALEVTATVTKELLQLMELVDGVRMKDTGIAFDKNGNIKTQEAFIKQLVPMEQEELSELYGNKEVFFAVSGKLYRPDLAAGSVLEALTELGKIIREIEELGARISGYQRDMSLLQDQLEAEEERLSKLETPDISTLLSLQESISNLSKSIEQDTKRLKECEEQKEKILLAAEGEYNTLQQKMQVVQVLFGDAIKSTERLKIKQEAAKVAVSAYESFLEGAKEKLSKELYQVFAKELETMKLYAGLEEQGFSVEVIRQTLQKNRGILESISLNGFSEKRLSNVAEEMARLIQQMQYYTVEGLQFPYGTIVVPTSIVDNVLDVLGELLTTGILELVGVSKEEQSDRKLTGRELPSAWLEQETVFTELKNCLAEVTGLFSDGGMEQVLMAAGDSLLESTALELYSRKYFHSYREAAPYTKLNYEREYLVFGAEKDKSNLFAMVLHLVAIRTLLCMVMLLKQPEKVARVELLAAGVVGFTGIPVLAAVVKYSLLLLWSVEEALVETAALLQGKRIPLVGPGTITFEELFLMNKKTIQAKAKQLSLSAGAAYTDYLTLLSLTRGTKKKAYRALDLIQENIRYRYNDKFRIRNVITGFSLCATSEVVPLFDTGFFRPSAYEMNCYKEKSY